MTRFISQDSVAAAATEIVKTADDSIDITGAWITGSALRLLLQSIRSKIAGGQLVLRIVCRLHGLTYLDITDLAAIKEYASISGGSFQSVMAFGGSYIDAHLAPATGNATRARANGWVSGRPRR